MELIRRLGTRKHKNSSSSYGLFLCLYCNKEVVKILGQGRKCKSCGCFKKELLRRTFTQHGDSKRYGKFYSLNTVWDSMKQRCYNKNRKDYRRYGGRGIAVCVEWRNSYTEFKKWALSNGYKKGLTIDRIDNDGNYEPNNCRFVSSLINTRNSPATKLNMNLAREIRRKNRENGITQRDLAKEYFVSEASIWRVVHNVCWKEF